MPPKPGLTRHPTGILVLEVCPDDKASDAPAEVTATPEAIPDAPAEGVANANGSTGLLAAIATDWLAHLKATGTSASTLASYEADLGYATSHFGSMDHPGMWTESDIATFEASAKVTCTKSGKPKAKPTIMKTCRVLRLAVTWAFETKRIKSTPYAYKGRVTSIPSGK